MCAQQDPTPSGPAKSATPGATPELNHDRVFEALLKEYELATNRSDKTDDRIIQLISIGLAALGAIFLFLRQQQESPETPSGVTFFSASQADASLQNPLNLGALNQYAVPCLLLFIIFYVALRVIFRRIYIQKGWGRPFPPYLEELLSYDPKAKEPFSSDLEELLSYDPKKPLSPDLKGRLSSDLNKLLSPSFGELFPLFPLSRKKTESRITKWKKDVEKERGEVLKLLAKGPKPLSDFMKQDEKSLKKMNRYYNIPPIIFAAIIFVVEIFFAPDHRSQMNSPALELLWFAPLFFLGFNSLIIYLMFSSIGHLWLSRTISQRLNWLLGASILVRFDRHEMPSLFFSYGNGNWKPRMSYWLLLATIGVLFGWVIAVCFAHVYVKDWWQGSIFLGVYLFLGYLQFFTFSGVRHDLQKRYEAFFEKEERTIKEILSPKPKPDNLTPDANGTPGAFPKKSILPKKCKGFRRRLCGLFRQLAT